MTRPYKWQDDALCAEIGTEMFFPRKGGSTEDAKRICAACDVREACLKYALAMEENPPGVWGGTSPRQRRLMRERPVQKSEPRVAKGLRREWTEEEDQILREMVDEPNPVIGFRLKRPLSSIRSRRKALGLPPSTDRGGRRAAA